MLFWFWIGIVLVVYSCCNRFALYACVLHSACSNTAFVVCSCCCRRLFILLWSNVVSVLSHCIVLYLSDSRIVSDLYS